MQVDVTESEDNTSETPLRSSLRTWMIPKAMRKEQQRRDECDEEQSRIASDLPDDQGH
ncbi:MAG: hypothetical protein ACM3VT_19060 [Solirubrobacterales bacterium]